MANQTSDTWTEDRVAILVAEHGKGTRRLFIAHILNEKTGSAFTKSAVCGKIDRLFPAEKPIKTEEEKAATKARRRERDRAKKQRERAESGVKPRAKRHAKHKYETVHIVRANGNSDSMKLTRSIKTDQFIPRCVEIEPRHLTLIDLEPNDCRYPYGYDTVTFCGHPKQAGSSYCVPHHHLCLEPVRVPIRRFVGSAAA
jgi:hypothetical protein